MRGGSDLWHLPRNLFLVVILGLSTSVVQARAQALKDVHVVFRKLDNREITDFARKMLLQWYRQNKEYEKVGFERLLRTSVVYAEVVIGSDGIPERFLQIEEADLCGSAGCESFIYRKTPRGYEKVCELDLSDFDPERPDVGALVMPQKENGYHLIDTGSAIIHWHKRRAFNSGDLCWEKGYKG